MLGWLFGNSNAADKALDSVISGVDALVFTDEEKSVANQKVLDFKIEYARHTQNQSISRRVITGGVTAMWILVGLVTLAAKYFDNAAFADFAFKFLTDVVMQPFSIIVAFYFLAHMIKK